VIRCAYTRSIMRATLLSSIVMVACVPGFAQVTFFDNSASPGAGPVRVQYGLSNKITSNAGGSLTSILVEIGDYSGSTSGENFQLTVCPDNGGQPAVSGCSSFSNAQYFPGGTETGFPSPYSYNWFTFTGTFQVTANQPFWVTMSSNTTGLYSRNTPGGGLAYIGTGYQSPYNVLTQQSYTWRMALTGTNAPTPTPAPISNTALLTLAGTLAVAGWWMLERRQRV
jgi:hypothetical protein